MDNIISPYQTAFVKGRLISNNIIMGGELFNIIQKRKKGKGVLGALKIDMDKAYGRLSWSVIKLVLECTGFNSHCIKLIMECIRTISFQLWNTLEVHQTIKRNKTRGHSFPYIFIMCQNILSLMLIMAKQQQDLQGIQLSRSSPPLVTFYSRMIALCSSKLMSPLVENSKLFLTISVTSEV